MEQHRDFRTSAASISERVAALQRTVMFCNRRSVSKTSTGNSACIGKRPSQQEESKEDHSCEEGKSILELQKGFGTALQVQNEGRQATTRLLPTKAFALTQPNRSTHLAVFSVSQSTLQQARRQRYWITARRLLSWSSVNLKTITSRTAQLTTLIDLVFYVGSKTRNRYLKPNCSNKSRAVICGLYTKDSTVKLTLHSQDSCRMKSMNTKATKDVN